MGGGQWLITHFRDVECHKEVRNFVNRRTAFFSFFFLRARNAPRTVHGLSLPLCNLFSFNASFFITLSKLSVLRTFDSLLDGIPSLAEFIFQ